MGRISGPEISYSEAVVRMCDRQLRLNAILERQEKGEISKEQAYDEIAELAYDDWYIQQIKDKS